MGTVQEFFRNPLVSWVTSFRTSSPAETVKDFADGVFLNEVMVEIDPTYFTLTRVHQNVDGDVNVRIQNLDFLVRHLKTFYQEKLQQLVLMRAPDVVAIANCPDSDVGLQELVKLLLLMLGCAVQCDNKENFIEKITNMDVEAQKHLVEYIKQITENANHVLTFRMNELQESTIEHVLVVAESMFYQMGHLIEERDQSFADNTHLKLEKEMLLQERQRAKSPRPFSPPPSTSHLAADSPSVAASKEKLRVLTEELEEKNSLMAELKDELLASKKMIERLRQENKDLSQDAVLVKAFRDQIDVLKEKADKVEKLEADSIKYKEKLRDLEYFKKRKEELQDENTLLLDNRQLLCEQLSGLSNKDERIEILEEENKKLKGHIHHIAEERQSEQEKLNEVMATNAKLNIEKQESMAEVASLNAEIDVLRGKSPPGSANLASEFHESSSMDVLRLSHQNEHLKKSLEDLRSSSTKLIELERENRGLHQKYLEEKSTVHRLNEELAKAKALNKQKTQEIEQITRSLRALQNDLNSSSAEVLNLSGELKQKDEAIANLEDVNYSQVNELQEKLKDAEGKELSMTSLKERVLKHEMQLVTLDNKNKDKDVVITQKQKTIDDLTESLQDKDRQLRSLQSRLSESVEDQSKSDNTLRKQKKEIAELENKLEEEVMIKKKYEQMLKGKQHEIIEYSQSVEEIESLTSEKNRLTQNLEQKMKQIIDLESSLEDFKGENLRLQHNWTQKNNKVKELESKLVELENYVELSQSLQKTLNKKDEKIITLNNNFQEMEEQLTELENGFKDGEAKNHKLKHTIKIKDEKILTLENRIEEFEGLDNETKKLSQLNQQKEEKIETLENKLEELDGVANTNEKLQKALSQKEEKISRLQDRLDDVEDAVNMNNKLNQHLKNRDIKIKALGERIFELEETLEVKEKEQMTQAQANYTKIRELETSLELVKSVKVQRQNSVKRRDDKIYDLEHRKTQLEEYVQEREAKVVALQSRLDGSVDRYRQMDMTIGEKEMKIAELEAKLSEANDACRENNKLSQMLKAKDARLTEFDNKVQLLESSLGKCEKRELERNDKLEVLQKRLEETLNLNNKLDKSVRKKEENIRILERTLQANEKREEEIQVLLETRTEKLTESKNRVIELNDVIENKDNEIEELNKRLNELCTATTSEQKSTTLLKEKDKQVEQLTERLDEVEADKASILRTLKKKQKEIDDLEQRVASSPARKTETKITVLTQNNQKLEENLFNLETQLEESNCQVNNLSRKLDQKDERIKGLKNRLEDAVHQNNKLTHALDLKEDKIRATEERLGDASKQMVQLREENQSRLAARDSKPTKSSSTIIFKPAYNSRDAQKTVQMLTVADRRIADLNDEIRVLEKQNATVRTQSEALSSRNAQLQIENESLYNELRLVKGDYSSLQGELNEARDYYHQLDLSAVNMGHRCEMLSQLNATLEEENKALHDKVSWLMGQNRDLMVKNIEEKDQFMEEERIFSDKLYSLQRTKEKLEEQIDLANKALSETPKKKPGFFKKIFKKGGAAKKKEDAKTPNKNQVQLVRADFHDNIDKVGRHGDHFDDNGSYTRSSSDYLDELGSSRDSSLAGDSGRVSKSQVATRTYPPLSTPPRMSPQEEFHGRKISHDVSAFRARQVRSEIFSDNFNAGQLSRPKSLDNLHKIGGFRGSNETLSSASAVTVDNVPSKNYRRNRKRTPPPSPPSSAFRVVQKANGSPYSTPNSARRAEGVRSSPSVEKDYPRKMKSSPQPLNDSSQQDGSTPSPSVSRSRRSSFSSAVSGHDSDHELDRREEPVSSKRSSVAERVPPPSYQSGLNSSFRRGDELSPQGRRSSRGPPPPYPRQGVDEIKQDEFQSTPERRPPPYPEASRSSLQRSSSMRSKTGTPREEPMHKNIPKETPSPRDEQRHWDSQSTPQHHRPNPLPMDAGSPIKDNRHESSIDSEQEIVIDATQSTVSASPAQNKSKDDNIIIPTFFKPVESLKESPLRRMNSMPRYNSRSRSMDESGPGRQTTKTKDTLFAAVLVRQRSFSDDSRRSAEDSQMSGEASRRPGEVRRPRDLPLSIPEYSPSDKPAVQTSSPANDDRSIPKTSKSLDSPQRRHDESDTDTATERSVDSESEGRPKSRSGSKTPLRGKNTHQWLEYGCV